MWPNLLQPLGTERHTRWIITTGVEALKEAMLDIQEGADILMVKPAGLS